jgi:hypothetical protein
MRLIASLSLLALGSLALGCGGTTSPSVYENDDSTLSDTMGADTTSSDTTSSDTTVSDTTVSDTSPQPDSSPGDTGTPDTGVASCPATAPSSGSACPKNGLQCQYGADPRLPCKTLATCQGTTWQITPPPASECGGPTPTCPATQPTGQCSSPGEICGYGSTTCDCSCGPLCGPGNTGFWSCQSALPGCPTTPPNAGTACTTNGATCRYQCGPDGARQCSAGTWKLQDGGPCPVSTRKAKEQIVYLDDADADRIAREVQAMRLATWVYKAPLDDGRPHMGIVLEDQPKGSYAVDLRSNMVDLYGYSSMLLATVQSQQRELDRQKKEIDALRADLDAIKAEIRGGKRK